MYGPSVPDDRLLRLGTYGDGGPTFPTPQIQPIYNDSGL
jgi:hypothetical protein